MVENSSSREWTAQGLTAEVQRKAYFNHAGQAPLDPEVENAGIEAIRKRPWEKTRADDQQRVRELFATMINADPSRIAIVPSTAFAITLAARNVFESISNKNGRIVVIQDQMCSAIYPWQDLISESSGNIILDIVQHPSKSGDENWTKGIINKLDDDVLVVCLPPLHWSDGTLIDLEAISVTCARYDIPLLVDATQAVGVMPCDVKSFNPALLACSIHKWLRGPPGMSLVYISPEFQNSWLPLDMHGRSRELPGGSAWDASKNEMGPTGYPEKYFPDARKFDSGGKPNHILLPMLRTSMERVVQLNVEETQKQLKELIEPLLEWAEKHDGCSVPSHPHAYHLVGISFANRTPKELLDICQSLANAGILAAVRCGVLRVSSYLTNTKEDVRRLIEALEELI